MFKVSRDGLVGRAGSSLVGGFRELVSGNPGKMLPGTVFASRFPAGGRLLLLGLSNFKWIDRVVRSFWSMSFVPEHVVVP